MKKYHLIPRIFIFCAGEIAEPNYFQDLKDYLRSKTIIVIKSERFQKCSPWELIDRVIAEKKRLIERSEFRERDGDQCWCVFDIDDYWSQNKVRFGKSISKAEKNGVKLAWSNECFELWYLLHFQEVTSAIGRVEYDRRIKGHFLKKFGIKYEKGYKVFDKLSGLQSVAVRNAKKIFADGKVDKNPATAVFKLVEELEANFS